MLHKSTIICNIGKVLLFLLLNSNLAGSFKLVWPTSGHKSFPGIQYNSYIQPAGSGKIESGLYGCVRSNGNQFHEGIDIKAVRRDRRGEALDNIVAAMDGEISHISKIAGKSSYGRYIVIEHTSLKPALYTLYAHLKSVSSNLIIGQKVKAGQTIGVMGRSSSGYRIPKYRAHLHFEIGFRLTNNFDSWYQWKKFDNKNFHGNYNGYNLSGIDPIAFYRAYQSSGLKSLKNYIFNLPTAYKLRVISNSIPWFVKRYPSIVMYPNSNDKLLYGWDIEFTASGIPKKWIPLTDSKYKNNKVGNYFFLKTDQITKNILECCETFNFSRKDPMLEKNGLRSIQLLFDYR